MPRFRKRKLLGCLPEDSEDSIEENRLFDEVEDSFEDKEYHPEENNSSISSKDTSLECDAPVTPPAKKR